MHSSPPCKPVHVSHEQETPKKGAIDGYTKSGLQILKHLPQFIFDPVQALVFGLEKGAIGLQLRNAVVSSVHGSEEKELVMHSCVLFKTLVSIEQNSSSHHVLLNGQPSGVSWRATIRDGGTNLSSSAPASACLRASCEARLESHISCPLPPCCI